ncbi:hypothetical protein D3C87_103650 [compost metagenome]
MKKTILSIMLVAGVFGSWGAYASSSIVNPAMLKLQNEQRAALIQIYETAFQKSILSLSKTERMDYFSSLFLGKPYLGGALGEGPFGRYDLDPLYRFDVFDCTTFVETVMALTQAKSPKQFTAVINDIRYENGVVDLFKRNHFTSVDWNPNNEKRGFVKDVTAEVARHRTSYMRTLIAKDNWYIKLAPTMLAGVNGTPNIRMNEIRHTGGRLGQSTVDLPYVDAKVIVEDPSILDHIPSGSVINMVRKNWNVKAALGTDLDVSHQGVAIRKNGVLILRHASFKKGSEYVLEVPLLTYIQNNVRSDTFAGINILEILGD